MTPSDFISRFSLTGKRTLDVGCNDGRHSVELARAGAHVHAVDAREENLKLAYKACEGLNVRFERCNLEGWMFPVVDACWHCGVLYHLRYPVYHLVRNLPQIKQCLYLSTHYVNGAGNFHREFPDKPREGMGDTSLRLSRQTILDVLMEFGFEVEIVDDRVERNGPRIELVAWRKT